MKKILAVLLLMTAAALGQQTSVAQMATREDIVKMLEVMQVKKQTQAVMDNMQASMSTMFDSVFDDASKKNHMTFTPEERKQMKDRQLQYMKDLQAAYPISEMIDDMIPVYQKYVTHEDALAIIAFYQSPAGQHLVAQGPEMTKEAMTIVMPKMQERLKPIVEKMTSDATAMAQAMVNKHNGTQ